MPEWTTEVISWVAGAGGVGLVLGWLVSRFLSRKKTSLDYNQAIARERDARREARDSRSARQATEGELQKLRSRQATMSGELDATQRLLNEARAETETARAQSSKELEGLNASLQNELEAARARYAELHNSQGQVVGNLDSAEARIADLDQLQERMREHLSTSQARIESFETRSSAASDDLFVTRARMSEVEGKLAVALSTLRSASEGLGTAHERLTGRPITGNVSSEHMAASINTRGEPVDLNELPPPPAVAVDTSDTASQLEQPLQAGQAKRPVQVKQAQGQVTATVKNETNNRTNRTDAVVDVREVDVRDIDVAEVAEAKDRTAAIAERANALRDRLADSLD